MAERKVHDRVADGRVALVTGASGTIGSALAISLGSAGFRVAVHYRHGKRSADAVVEGIVGQLVGGLARWLPGVERHRQWKPIFRAKRVLPRCLNVSNRNLARSITW